VRQSLLATPWRAYRSYTRSGGNSVAQPRLPAKDCHYCAQASHDPVNAIAVARQGDAPLPAKLGDRRHGL